MGGVNWDGVGSGCDGGKCMCEEGHQNLMSVMGQGGISQKFIHGFARWNAF